MEFSKNVLRVIIYRADFFFNEIIPKRPFNTRTRPLSGGGGQTSAGEIIRRRVRKRIVHRLRTRVNVYYFYFVFAVILRHIRFIRPTFYTTVVCVRNKFRRYSFIRRVKNKSLPILCSYVRIYWIVLNSI